MNGTFTKLAGAMRARRCPISSSSSKLRVASMWSWGLDSQGRSRPANLPFIVPEIMGGSFQKSVSIGSGSTGGPSRQTSQ